MARPMGAFSSMRFAIAGLALALAAACGKGGGGGGGGGSDGGDGGSSPCYCLPDGGYPDGGRPDGGGPCVCPGDDGSVGSGGLELRFVRVEEALHNLDLVGDFGNITTPSDTRVVRVGQGDLAVEYRPPQAEWLGFSHISVHNFPSNGPGSAGDIQVINGSLRSNILQLTDWRGLFTVTQYGAPGSPGATAHIQFDWLAHLRASINGAGVGAHQISVIAVDDTTCTFDADGFFDSIDMRTHTTWARNPAVDPNIPWNPMLDRPSVQVIPVSTIDLDRRGLTIIFAAFVDNGRLVTVLDRMTGQSQTFPERIAFNDGVRDFAARFDPNWVILGGSYMPPVGGAFKVEWRDIVPRFPPR